MNSNTSRTAWGFDNMLCRRSDDETHPDNDVKHDNKNDLCDNSEHQTCGPREVRLKHGEILDRRQCSRPQGSLRSQHSALPFALALIPLVRSSDQVRSGDIYINFWCSKIANASRHARQKLSSSDCLNQKFGTLSDICLIASCT